MNQIYFVSSSGSNSNDGSNIAPWATVQYAIDTITSQAVVQNTDLFIKEGSYPEIVSLIPFLGPGTITLRAQNLPPALKGIVQSGSNYSLSKISLKNTSTTAILVTAGTLTINDLIISTSDLCIAVTNQGTVSTSGTLEVNGNIKSIISCSEEGTVIYNSNLIGNAIFSEAFCQMSGGKVIIFKSLSNGLFVGDRVKISNGVLTIKSPSTSPIDTLPGSSYGLITEGQIYNNNSVIFPLEPSSPLPTPPPVTPPLPTLPSTIDASLITQGTLSNARLTSDVTLQGNTFNGNSQLVKTTNLGKLPALDASLLFNINSIPNASLITQGTLSNARLTPQVTLAGNAFNTASNLVKLTTVGKLPPLDGSDLINLPSNKDASLLSLGILSNARLSSSVTLEGNSFNNSNQLVKLDNLGKLPAIDGSQLTGIVGSGGSDNASDLISGTLADARLTSNVTLQGNIFNAANKLVLIDSLGRLPDIDGSLLTGITAGTNASLLTSGTLPDARLPSNVVRLDGFGRLPAVDGSLITNLPTGNTNASFLSSGTLSDARLTTNVTLKGNSFNGANQLVVLDSTGKLPAIDGSQLTNMTSGNTNASFLNSGTLSDARLTSNVTLQGNTFNSASSLVRLDGVGRLPALDGSLLTNVNIVSDASLLTAGTLPDARLSSNVTQQGNTFNNANQLVRLDSISRLPAADGSLLTNLPSSNASGIVTGTLADARLTANVTLQGNLFNGPDLLLKLASDGKLPAVDGSNLTNLPGGNSTNLSLANQTSTTIDVASSSGSDVTLPAATITQAGLMTAADKIVLDSTTDASLLSSGTLPDARLSNNITAQGNSFNGANQLVKILSDGKLPAIDGSNLTNLPGGGGSTNLSLANQTSTTIDVLSSTGTDVTLPAATTTQAGLMSAADKVALASGGGGASPIISSDLLIAKDYADNSSLPSSLILTAGTTSYSSSPQRRIVESGATLNTNNFTLNRATTLLIRVTSNTPLVETKISLRKASDDSLLYWVGLQGDTNLVHYKNAATPLNVLNGAWTANKTYDIKIVIDPTHAYISTQLNSSSTPFITTDAHSIALGTDLYFSYVATGGQLLVDEMIAYKSSNKDISYTITPSAPLVQTIGNNTDTSFTITHNLNSKNVGTIIYETASPYELVTATVKYSTLNTITIETGIVPTTNQFTVVAYPLTSYFEVPLKNSVNTYTKAQGVTPVALTYGSTIPVDATLSNSFTVTLGGNGQFLNPTGLINGFIYNYFITQDGTGSRIPTWDTSYSFGVAGIPTLSTAAGKLDWLRFIYIAGKLCFAGASIGF